VDESPWQGSGPEFTLSWGSRQWILKLDDPGPGLCPAQADTRTKILALDRLALPSRCDFEAFSSKTLLDYERYRRSVRATFAPPSWAGLRVRASWSVSAGEAVDLEVQVSASSVGELERLEVGVVSRLGLTPSDLRAAPVVLVEARDSASLSDHDRRDSSEPAPFHIHFFSPTRPLRPSFFPAPGGPDDLYYAEMAHPDDVARRVSFKPEPEGSAAVSGRAVGYSLFGLELEKGVVLRARLRGCWIRSRNPEQDAALLLEQFLHEPPPLGP
jgi:hypothetical protein